MSAASLKNRRYDQNGAASSDTPRRFFDSRYGKTMVKVMPGMHCLSDDPDEILVTVLGSCVAACIRDPDSGIGGMNHFMLPESEFGDWGGVSAAMRFGNHAMEILVNDVLRSGCPRRRLEIKVFGGANLIKGRRDIGHTNAAFIERYLTHERLPIAASDLGGTRPRRIHYYPSTGKVRLRYLGRSDDQSIFDAERRLVRELRDKPVGGEIELFD